MKSPLRENKNGVCIDFSEINGTKLHKELYFRVTKRTINRSRLFRQQFKYKLWRCRHLFRGTPSNEGHTTKG